MNEYLALVIEDEPDLAHIFAQALETAGFVTEVAANGREALRRIEVLTPHIVILDLHLPDVDGGHILRHIRAQPRLAGTRVMIASADAVMAGALDLEADLVLLKPVGFSQLRDLAQRLLIDIQGCDGAQQQ